MIILGHVGFEAFGTIRQILSNIGPGRRVVLKAWRYPRAEIPVDDYLL